MAEYDAVLWDLDGTLCAYERSPPELVSEAFEAVGVEPLFDPAAYPRRVKDYVEEIETIAERRRRCFADMAEENGYDPELGRQVAAAFAEQRDHTYVRYLDGADRALEYTAERYPLGLITNGDPDAQGQKVDGLGASSYFETIVYAGAETAAKPDPEPFERAISTIDVDPASAVYVGNSYETDVLGAAAAGIPAVMVGNPPADPPVDPIATVETPGEIPDLL